MMSVSPQDSHGCPLPPTSKKACSSVPSDHLRQTAVSGGLLMWTLAVRYPLTSSIYYDTSLHLRINDSEPPQKVERQTLDVMLCLAFRRARISVGIPGTGTIQNTPPRHNCA